MGNKPQKLKKSNKEVKSLMEATKFTLDELTALHSQFLGIRGGADDTKGDPMINRKEFQVALGSRSSFFVDRIFNLFDTDNDGKIKFEEFARGIALLAKGTYAQKLKFSFDIYDISAVGHIDKTALRKMLTESLKENNVPLSAAQIDSLVDSTFEEADLNKDGVIDFKEYTAMVNKHRAMLDHLDLNVTDMIKEAHYAAAAAASAGGGGAGGAAGAGSRKK